MVAVVYYNPSSSIAWSGVEHADDAGVASILLKLLANHTSTALEKLSYVINSFKLLGHRQNRRVPTASFRTANPRYTVHAVMRLCLIRRRILVDIKPRFRVIFLLPLPSRFG